MLYYVNEEGTKRVAKTSRFPYQIARNGHGMSVVWCPGDGTRYVFLFQSVGCLMEHDGAVEDTLLGTVFNMHGGNVSMLFAPGGGSERYLLDYGYAEEKFPSLKDSSALPAFVAVANWLFGSVDYADGVYATMCERYGFQNLLK